MRLIILLLFVYPILTFAQSEKISGPVIKEFGETFKLPSTDFKTNPKEEYKVVFDVGRSFDNPGKANPLFLSAARFLNMHVEAGIPKEKIKIALVVHGEASNELLTHEKYSKKFLIDNPNYDLLTALMNQNVQIILCGQTAAYRKITKADIHPKVQLSLSAMTALVLLQNDNYRLINF